ncbi:hypothetical protein E3Q22_01907 [Wallemia mellicola]|uniref:ER membrane protein complex subunit 6 n=2 Tax=Wallemia mellicola TaxID=1708541 RepID=A0A4T0P6P5_9BASI|nr:hypothetical protein WALSEDRAFT_67321 [Wallemia mellicola CBS 633.66]TIB73162.1 hypothetical protein E3Q23_03099 [Wallemia mellicola]EIM23696.1 hypothetical protein WALSEDRAFT_67321 [Wallemia mellicola CBS 633.66]TIB73616.1 hypothetical protein E3Q24_01053 [Wallemia mellicola]TIB80386.1 hypothetical protein E3Q22_01907 [Wallemia mellicola]TIB85039.1 hypothetical protein E3Q21_02148 [Wallemia mellicola]|eukprot:XP_006956362.1 hypothetical protein WALSEDRAFT_67321 [Wallemia mellicola CBS 633.66]
MNSANNVQFNEEEKREPIYTDNQLKNNRELFVIRSTLSMFLGGVAGVLGLTNLYGLIFYLLLAPSLPLLIITLKTQSTQYQSYYKDGLSEIVIPTSDSLFGFILVWTMAYGLVHLYE